MGRECQSHMCHIEKELKKDVQKNWKRKRLERERSKGYKERDEVGMSKSHVSY